MKRSDFRYQAFYCEENAWWLVRDSRLEPFERWMVFVTNPSRQCPVWCQRAGAPGGPVVWDYHVFVVADLHQGLHALDLDTTLEFPIPLDRFLAASFPDASTCKPVYRPMFRVVPSADALAQFASDRRHMRLPGGRWRAPPPSWPPIQGAGAPHNLERWLDLTDRQIGTVCGLEELPAAFGQPPTALSQSCR